MTQVWNLKVICTESTTIWYSKIAYESAWLEALNVQALFACVCTFNNMDNKSLLKLCIWNLGCCSTQTTKFAFHLHIDKAFCIRQNSYTQTKRCQRQKESIRFIINQSWLQCIFLKPVMNRLKRSAWDAVCLH